MATPTTDEVRDQALDVLAQAQEAGLRLAGTVAESWAAVLRGVPGAGALNADSLSRAEVPHTAVEAVDRFYDTGVQVLEAQRSAVHQLLGAVAPALRPLTLVTPAAARR